MIGACSGSEGTTIGFAEGFWGCSTGAAGYVDWIGIDSETGCWSFGIYSLTGSTGTEDVCDSGGALIFDELVTCSWIFSASGVFLISSFLD